MRVIWCEDIDLSPLKAPDNGRERRGEILQTCVWHWSGGGTNRTVKQIHSVLSRKGLGYDYIFSRDHDAWVHFNPDQEYIALHHAGFMNGESIGACIPGRRAEDVRDAIPAALWLVQNRLAGLKHVGHYEVSSKKKDPGKELMLVLSAYTRLMELVA